MHPVTGLAAFWRKLCDLVEQVSRILVGGCILAVVLITIAAVWYRYVVNDPLSWTEQVCRILFVWSVFAGAGILYRNVLHITIDMFVPMMPDRIQRVISGINHVLMLFLGLMMLFYGSQISLDTLDQTFGALEISPASFYSAAPFCGLLIILFWIEKMLDPTRRVPMGEVHL